MAKCTQCGKEVKSLLDEILGTLEFVCSLCRVRNELESQIWWCPRCQRNTKCYTELNEKKKIILLRCSDCNAEIASLPFPREMMI